MATLLQHDSFYRAPTDADLRVLGDLEYRGPIYDIKKLIIGVTGEKGHGKDTVCNRLSKFGVERHAWADELKVMARRLWDLSHEQVHGTIEQKETVDARWSLTPRHFLQVLGTDVARRGHPETWIRLLLHKLATDPTESTAFAISDVRFPNEADAIRKHGGIIVRVVRDFSTGIGEGHASELGVRAIKADFVLVNDRTFEDLHVLVDEVARVMQGLHGRKD